MDKKKELTAAIDIGSNTFRLLVAETDGSTISPVYKDLHTVRLAEGMNPTKKLQSAATKRGLTALDNFAKAISRYKPAKIRACGTAALRAAENSSEFIARAESIIKCKIEVISGEDEASLNLAGIISALPEDIQTPAMITDVGGGSTEIILPKACQTTQTELLVNKNMQTKSFPVGAINMTEKFFHRPNQEAEDLPKLATFLENIFLLKNDRDLSSLSYQSSATSIIHDKDQAIVASGGTATAIAALDLNLTEYKENLIQNHCISAEALDRILTKLLKLSHSERNQLMPLRRGRGDIIIAGTQIHKTLMQLSRATQLIVSDAGFLEGVLLSTLRH